MRFIKLFDKITEWEWYDDTVTFRVFMHLLLTANWKDTSWHGIPIKRGQRIITYRGLAKETSLTERQVRTALQHLRATHEVTQCSTHKRTTVTIENYEKYQGYEKSNDTLSDTQSDTVPTQDIELYRTIEDIKEKSTTYSKRKSSDLDTRPKMDDVREVVDMFNAECPSLSKVVALSEDRVNKVKARLSKHSKDELRLAFQKVEASDFATGKGKGERQWCSFDWIIKSESNLLKILEGHYDNKNNAQDKAISDMREITRGMTREEYEDMERRFK